MAEDKEEADNTAEEAVDSVIASEKSGKDEEAGEPAVPEGSEQPAGEPEGAEDEMEPGFVGDEDEDGCVPEQEVIPAQDVLRTALRAVGPVIAKLPKKEQKRICEDIAARLHTQPGREIGDAGIYAAIASGKTGKTAGNPADLGKRIMAKRNPNYRKG